jgi:tetratricopeptide (TPR) repeat protein
MMPMGRLQTCMRTGVLVLAVIALSGCDLLSNARFMDRFKRTPQPVASTPFSEQGIGKLAKGELLQAQALFDQALQNNPRDVHALLGKGLVFQQTGQLTQARAAYEAVLALRPGPSEKLIVFNILQPQSVQELAGLNLALLQSQGVSSSLTRPQADPNASQQQPGMMAPDRPPASMAQPMSPNMSRAAPTAALIETDANIVERFETLAKLRDEGLVTHDEYNARRQANIGALLNHTMPPGAAGLDRAVPSATQISQRLRAIGRALELRAITVRQHSAERTMIVDGLMPSNPPNRANQKPAPKSLLDAAAELRRVETLQERGLITPEEAAKEKAAIEEPFKAKAPPPPPKEAPKKLAKSDAMPQQAATVGPQPAVHIASFRSRQAANRGWAQLKRAHRALVGNFKSEITRVNLGRGKGVFYRLLVGPAKSQADAQRICTTLKRRRQYCEPAFMAGG